ncbi:MAG: hypothetical protein U0974_01235 [Gemmatimonadales bacterium]|nr:hypothetical protein [Gemmatimonadales bacterium]MDZ4388339.1 hypothetical protein [Gemmatimonadales bacterium]
MTPRVPGGSFTNYAKSLVAEHWGVTVHDDVYGVFVYENPETAAFMMLGELELAMREPLEGTLESWREALRPGPCMAEGVFVSYDLFAHSRFEISSRARFLLLVMAIEALLRPESGPPDEVAVLDAAIGVIRQSSLAENRKTTLASRLGQLKKESIGSAARAYLDRAWAAGVLSIADAADVFQTSYGIRSGMVHRGITPDPAELANRSGQLETIIKELLVAVLEGKRA